MPAQSGLFDSFDNLDQIAVLDITRWFKVVPNQVAVENYLANKILYPQILPLTKADLETDLAILREALAANAPKNLKGAGSFLGDNTFLNVTLRKILIPSKFLRFVPNLTTLIWAFVDAFLLERKRKDFFGDLWTIILTGEIDETVGSVLLPQFTDKNGILELQLGNQSYKVLSGSLMVIPCPSSRCQIVYKFNKGKILGKAESSVEVYGGRIGLFIDARNKKNEH